jgi:hypothetical protein
MRPGCPATRVLPRARRPAACARSWPWHGRGSGLQSRSSSSRNWSPRAVCADSRLACGWLVGARSEPGPVSGTSTIISRLASDSCVGWKAVRAPGGGSRSACLLPLEWRFSGVGAESPRVPPHGRFVGAVRLARLRGCGCRSRATRQATPERRRGRHGPAQARPSRSAGPERVTRTAGPRVTESRSNAKGGRAQYRRRCSRP